MTNEPKTPANPPPKPKLVKTTFEIPEDLSQRFKMMQVMHKVKMRQALEEAIEDWCDKMTGMPLQNDSPAAKDEDLLK